jgi:hypothetical protein
MVKRRAAWFLALPLAGAALVFAYRSYREAQRIQTVSSAYTACKQVLNEAKSSCDAWKASRAEPPPDAWGTPIRCEGATGNVQTVSYGADDKPGGTGSDADIVCVARNRQLTTSCTCTVMDE